MEIVGKVEVKAGTATSKTFNGKKGTFTTREQEGFVAAGDEIRKIRISLTDDQAPYPVGHYICRTPVNVGQYGDILSPRYLVLEPAGK